MSLRIKVIKTHHPDCKANKRHHTDAMSMTPNGLGEEAVPAMYADRLGRKRRGEHGGRVWFRVYCNSIIGCPAEAIVMRQSVEEEVQQEVRRAMCEERGWPCEFTSDKKGCPHEEE